MKESVTGRARACRVACTAAQEEDQALRPREASVEADGGVVSCRRSRYRLRWRGAGASRYLKTSKPFETPPEQSGNEKRRCPELLTDDSSVPYGESSGLHFSPFLRMESWRKGRKAEAKRMLEVDMAQPHRGVVSQWFCESLV